VALGKVLAWGNLGVAITLKELKAYHINPPFNKTGGPQNQVWGSKDFRCGAKSRLERCGAKSR